MESRQLNTLPYEPKHKSKRQRPSSTVIRLWKRGSNTMRKLMYLDPYLVFMIAGYYSRDPKSPVKEACNHRGSWLTRVLATPQNCFHFFSMK